MTLSFIFCLVAIVFSPATALAITISPPLMEFEGRAGETITDVVKVYNETAKTLNLTGEVQNFKALNENGAPEFFPNTTNDPLSLSTWLKLTEQKITLKPGEKKSILFNISIPKNAEPGGHFAGILWEDLPENTKNGQKVGVTAKTGSLILVNIAGEIKDEGRLIEFSMDKEKMEYLPAKFNIRFENTGNIYLKPTGKIEIKNIFGKQVASIEVNPAFSNVLPKSTRLFEAVWQKNEVDARASLWQKEKNNFALGKYEATVTLNYGLTNKTSTAQKTFWVFPWRVMLFYGVLGLIGLLFTIELIQKYNQWVLKKYTGKTKKPDDNDFQIEKFD